VVLIALLLTIFQDQSLPFGIVKREVVERRLGQFHGDNQEREATLKNLFEESGCQGERLSEQPVKHVKAPNVVCTLPGAAESVIVVGAHFDRVKKSLGVVDNWSGAALLPSLYESLSAQPRRHTLVFIGFTAEEEGEVGSEFYVKHLSKEQRQAIRAMINIDTLGVASSKVWTSRSDPRLLELLDQAAALTKLPIATANVEKFATTDSETFRKAKIPAMTIHAMTRETWPILHSRRDQLSAIKLDDYHDTFRLLSALLTLVDARLN
jgi:hypothetical protein